MMAYSSQQQYHRQQYSQMQHNVNNNEPPIPVSVNEMVLKQQPQRYHSQTMQTNVPNNANYYKPPPPITQSHKSHIKQHHVAYHQHRVMHQQNNSYSNSIQTKTTSNTEPSSKSNVSYSNQLRNNSSNGSIQYNQRNQYSTNIPYRQQKVLQYPYNAKMRTIYSSKIYLGIQ